MAEMRWQRNMPNSDELQEIFRRSMDELKDIAAWLDNGEREQEVSNL